MCENCCWLEIVGVIGSLVIIGFFHLSPPFCLCPVLVKGSSKSRYVECEEREMFSARNVDFLPFLPSFLSQICCIFAHVLSHCLVCCGWADRRGMGPTMAPVLRRWVADGSPSFWRPPTPPTHCAYALVRRPRGAGSGPKPHLPRGLA